MGVEVLQVKELVCTFLGGLLDTANLELTLARNDTRGTFAEWERRYDCKRAVCIYLQEQISKVKNRVE